MAIQEKQRPGSLSEIGFSEPARLLQEQAQSIAEESDGVLYGVVEQSELLPGGEVAYHLDVGITGKQLRFVSIFILQKLRSDYPVRITNMLEGDSVNIADAEYFKQYVCAILHNQATLDQFERMKEYARKP